ncbi:MAG: low molecular weight protein-tyrosine-phosphatase [Nannocystaceae bacterium]
MSDPRPAATSEDPPVGVLFVCYANLCRSPLAEGIFRALAAERGALGRMVIDSAGVAAMSGADPHPLSVAVARERGVTLTGRSRQLVRDDFHDFDEIVVMDRHVLREIRRLLTPSAFGPQSPIQARIRVFGAILDPHAEGMALDVADPITGGIDGFRSMYTHLERGCRRLLDELDGRA